MSPRSRPAERLGRRRSWLIPAALLAVAPKCGLCLLAYAGLGTALGLGGPELCGGSAGPDWSWPFALAVLGGALGVIHLLARRRRRSAV